MGVHWDRSSTLQAAPRETLQRRQKVGVLKRRNVPIMQIQAPGGETKAGKREQWKRRLSGDTHLAQSRQAVTTKTPLPTSLAQALPVALGPTPVTLPCSLISPYSFDFLSSVPWPSAIGHWEGKTLPACCPSNFRLPAQTLAPGGAR